MILCLNGAAFATEIGSVSIQQVSTIPEPNKNFSINIKFDVTGQNFKNWALGFYMPKTFNTLVDKKSGEKINPDLTMQICEANTQTHCSFLKYVKEKKFYSSAGYTNIIAPIKQDMPLEAGKSYVININHCNQGIPTNYSAMPQSFFLIENDNKIIPIADVSPEQYQMGNYNEQQVASAITKHHQDNWNQSKPLVSDTLSDHFHLIPTPVSVHLLKQAGFSFLQNGNISIHDDFKNHDQLALYLKQDFKITTVTKPENASITIKKIAMNNPEGYRLQIANNNIVISASTPAGAFYAIQTLRQLWNQYKSLPGLDIEDYPRFKYRGILLDVSRHFFTVNEIKKILDVMAAQKLNTLHLHFADDEGWRLDLGHNDLLSNLTSVGSIRGFTAGSKLQPAVFVQANLDISNRENFSSTGKMIHKNYPKANDRYAGFYSANDIKDLISYANARQITIIPEIDLPGHARALVHSIPEVFEDNNDRSNYISAQGYTDDVIPVCLYKNKNKKLTNVIDEIVHRINKMFANQTTVYHSNEVSLGGDEVSNLAWSNDRSCTGFWESLSALGKSQYFFNLVQQNNSQILLSGWQQLVQSENGIIGKYAIPAKSAAHIWVWEKTGNGSTRYGIKDAASLANSGYPIVLAFADDTYFDLTYTSDKWEPGFRWGGAYLDTHDALRSAFDSVQTERLIHSNQKQNLFGLEGTLWTENVANFEHVAYMVLPKMAGLAEAAWTDANITTSTDGKINWQSLAYRLGYNNTGFLGYLYWISSMKYRGYPYGISQETPCCHAS